MSKLCGPLVQITCVHFVCLLIFYAKLPTKKRYAGDVQIRLNTQNITLLYNPMLSIPIDQLINGSQSINQSTCQPPLCAVFKNCNTFPIKNFIKYFSRLCKESNSRLCVKKNVFNLFQINLFVQESHNNKKFLNGEQKSFFYAVQLQYFGLIVFLFT